MNKKRISLHKIAPCSLAMLAPLACSQAVDIDPGNTGADEQVVQATQHLDTTEPGPSEYQNPMKGHVKVTETAIKALRNRNLLPPQLDTWDEQYYVYYGNDFADHTWIGRPGSTDNPRATGPLSSSWVPSVATNIMNQLNNLPTDSREFSHGVGSVSWDDWHTGWDTLGIPISVHMRLSTLGDVFFSNELTEDHPNPYAKLDMTIYLDSLNWATGGSRKAIDKSYSLDNFYHYTFRDVYEMSGLSQSEKDQYSTLRLYPMVVADLGSVPDNDIAQHAINYIVNQPLLSGADRGITKYGAILYQLARKFFTNSCHTPSLAELIPAGTDRPGWSVGQTQGTGSLSNFKLNLPHTVLGGMPYVCANGTDPKDSCADGLPTWPIWAPDSGPSTTYPNVDNDFVNRLSVAEPGNSDRAALIYLGWASHILQDAATPHHAANLTGYEHDRQDGYGNDETYWTTRYWGLCPDGKYIEIPAPTTGTTPPKCSNGSSPTNITPANLVEWTGRSAINDLLGTEASPKSRDQICSSVNITGSQLMDGDLNYKSVQPLFLNTAQDAFRMVKTSTTSLSSSDLQTYVAGYLKNALVATIKLLVCAAPPATTTCAANGNTLLNQGTVQGTQQRFPWDFNIFTFGNASGLHDVAGPVAGGGDVTLSSFSVNGAAAKPVALVAGGQLSLQTGGSAWGNAYDGAGKSISSSATIYGKVIDSTPIGFSDARAKLIKVSGALAAYPSNGSTTIALPNVTFSGSQSSYNVFNIAASELANIRSFAINIPSGASAIINVVNDVPDSTGVVIQNAGFSTNGADPRRIFWNFNGVHKLATASLGFPGSIMAPEAAADIKYGYVDGTLIADSLVSTYTEFHWQPFRGDLPPVTP